MKRTDKVIVVKGQYKGMRGKIASIKVKGKGQGPHASVFIQDTLRTIIVTQANLRVL
jgi:ribosomal protein L24